MVKRKDNDTGTGGIALAIPPAAVRREQRLDAERDYEEWREAEAEQDISRSLDGAKAILGRAAFSAMRATVNKDDNEAESRDRRKAEADDALFDELERLAAWNEELTVVGGVTMTNGEAQEARQNVIDNDDAYADWAVAKGLITEDQKAEFKSTMRRTKELEEKRGRGTLSAAEAEEKAMLDRSDVARARDAATAYDHVHKGIAPSVQAKKADADSALRGAAPAADRRALFESAPDASAAFQQASSDVPERRIAAPIAPAIKATGLDL